MAKHLIPKDLENLPNFPITQDQIQPTNPKPNHWWLDLSVIPHILYRWNGVKWTAIGNTGGGNGSGGIDASVIAQLQERISIIDSQIVVLKNDLDSKVSRTQYDTERIATTNRLSNLESKAIQHLDMINLKVSLVDYQKDKTSILSRLTDSENRIIEHTNLLGNVTQRDVIIATINQSVEKAKIKGALIDLTGVVRPEDLKTTQLTLTRPDGFVTVDKGTLNVPIYIPGAYPFCISDNVDVVKAFFRTGSINREDVHQMVFTHTARYLKVILGMYSEGDASVSMAVEEEDSKGTRNVLGSKNSSNTDKKSPDATKGQVLTIDLGEPKGMQKTVYVTLRSTLTGKNVYGRVIQSYLEG
jgi:hypothetical protein